MSRDQQEGSIRPGACVFAVRKYRTQDAERIYGGPCQAHSNAHCQDLSKGSSPGLFQLRTAPFLVCWRTACCYQLANMWCVMSPPSDPWNIINVGLQIWDT